MRFLLTFLIVTFAIFNVKAMQEHALQECYDPNVLFTLQAVSQGNFSCFPREIQREVLKAYLAHKWEWCSAVYGNMPRSLSISFSSLLLFKKEHVEQVDLLSGWMCKECNRKFSLHVPGADYLRYLRTPSSLKQLFKNVRKQCKTKPLVLIVTDIEIEFLL